VPITIISSKAVSKISSPSSSLWSEVSALSIIWGEDVSLGSLTLFRFSCVATVALFRLLVGEDGRSQSPNIFDRRTCVTNPRCSILAVSVPAGGFFALNFAVDSSSASSSSDSDSCNAAKRRSVKSEGPGAGETLRGLERRYQASGTQNLKFRFAVDLKGLAEKGNSTSAEICVVGDNCEVPTTESNYRRRGMPLVYIHSFFPSSHTSSTIYSRFPVPGMGSDFARPSSLMTRVITSSTLVDRDTKTLYSYPSCISGTRRKDRTTSRDA